ncbi:unnamed protein product [Owenia fusiformis]|uniref:Phytanoyl-CoA dioxygenase n=1 Tax=Owenia fusiformis TaxID=6347 RepID=A0A8S4NF47_OWEFU|nr:unnamed protein product [Owenia fusiformis]
MRVAMASQFSSIELSERVELSELKKSFKRDGYFRLNYFLTPEEIQNIRSHLEEYQEKIVPTIPNRYAFYENKADESTLIRLERMLGFSDFFKELAEGVFKDIAELLMEEKCEVNNVSYFCKPPGAKPTPPHQDGQYFMHSKDAFVTQEETQEVGPGTLLGHHPLTIHLAGENRSKRWRPALCYSSELHVYYILLYSPIV